MLAVRSHTRYRFAISDPRSLEVAWKWIYEATRKLVRNFALHVNIERALTNGLIWYDTPLEDRPIVCV